MRKFDQAAPQREAAPSMCSFFVRPLTYTDLGVLLPQVGPIVDIFYPSGAYKLIGRLERSIAYHEYAYVAACVHAPHIPVALASEKLKGAYRLKLCTFWVSPYYRRIGVGSLLLQERIATWLRSDFRQVHGTISHKRAPTVQPLFFSLGFRQIAVEIARYGEGRDEAVFTWKPEWMSSNIKLRTVGLGRELRMCTDVNNGVLLRAAPTWGHRLRG